MACLQIWWRDLWEKQRSQLYQHDKWHLHVHGSTVPSLYSLSSFLIVHLLTSTAHPVAQHYTYLPYSPIFNHIPMEYVP